MSDITLTEKLWDSVRPSSVTKTGLSEAIRSLSKLVAKTPSTPKGFDDWIKGIEGLRDLIDKTEVLTRKAKDDKKGAAAKLTAWSKECGTELTRVRALRTKAGMDIASKLVMDRVDLLSKGLDERLAEVRQIGKILDRASVSDIKSIAKSLQECRTAAKDALALAQKDGMTHAIRTYDALREWAIDPHDVPFPPQAKALRDRAVELQDLCETLRIAIEEQVDGKTQSRAGAMADLAEPLRLRYRKLASDMKNLVPAAKKFGVDAKTAGDKAKELLAQGVTPDKLYPLIEKIQERVLAFEERANALNFEGRSSKGQLLKDKREAKKDLNPQQADEFETIIMDEWNVCMVVYREISERSSEAYRQVDRMLRLIEETHPAEQAEARRLQQAYDKQRNAGRQKYI